MITSFVTLILSNLKAIALGASSLISLYLFKANKDLKNEKQKVEENLQETQRIIDIQKKVIDVTQNTTATDLDGNLERMREDKL